MGTADCFVCRYLQSATTAATLHKVTLAHCRRVLPHSKPTSSRRRSYVWNHVDTTGTPISGYICISYCMGLECTSQTTISPWPRLDNLALPGGLASSTCLQMDSVTKAYRRMYLFFSLHVIPSKPHQQSSAHQQIQRPMQAILMPAMWGALVINLRPLRVYHSTQA